MQLVSTFFVLAGVYVVSWVINFGSYPGYCCGVELLGFLLLHEPNRARIYRFGHLHSIPLKSNHYIERNYEKNNQLFYFIIDDI